MALTVSKLFDLKSVTDIMKHPVCIPTYFKSVTLFSASLTDQAQLLIYTHALMHVQYTLVLNTCM